MALHLNNEDRNIFKDDFIEQIMLPYLNANNGIGYIEGRNKILKG